MRELHCRVTANYFSLDLWSYVASATAKDNRRLRDIQHIPHIPHRLVRNVRHVHHHPQAIHLPHANALSPSSRPAAVTVDAAVANGLSQLCVSVMYRTPNANSYLTTAVDAPRLVRALGAYHGRDPAPAEGTADARRGGAEVDLGGRGYKAAGGLDLLEGVADGVGWFVWVREEVGYRSHSMKTDQNCPPMALLHVCQACVAARPVRSLVSRWKPWAMLRLSVSLLTLAKGK